MRGAMEDADKLMRGSEDRAQTAAGLMRETVREAIEDAITRFSGATDEIRKSAADIKRELDDTRTELKRGAFDLPEETRESAAAMRRAVADQIKALQELSQIVGQSSQRVEVSEQAPRPAPRAAVQQAAPQRQAAPAAPAPAPRIEVPAQRVPLRGSLEATGAAPAKTDGWVSDLLRAASREEATPAPAPVAQKKPERNPRHVVESLNSLSVDIARAIDHDASVDLWRRYQRGERDVFTRRLYTLKGQQTFDEIKNKYGREPEFRAAVDRYIADFEKLLSDVARNDRDNMMTQTYLTSDTGKVYTMLAHASGRFDRD
jgi:archaellum component FlaC